MFSFTSRLESSMRGWPHDIKRGVRAYIRGFHRRSRSRSAPEGRVRTLPYWLLLPDWLAALYADKQGADRLITARTVNDILWGNYCLFLSVRIKDDLFDGHISDTKMVFAADQFLTDAFDILSSATGHSDRFRRMLISGIGKTLHSIVEVDRMQRRSRTSLTALRTGHAKVSSVFKIGSGAVCCLADRWRDFHRISKACDALAIAGQILDDFQDMEEDFEDGRLNYAARFILGTSRPASPTSRDTLHRMAERLLFSDRTERLLTEVIAHVRAAGDALAPLAMKETADYVRQYIDSLERMRDEMSRERLRRIFDLDAADRVKNRSGTK